MEKGERGVPWPHTGGQPGSLATTETAPLVLTLQSYVLLPAQSTVTLGTISM